MTPIKFHFRSSPIISGPQVFFICDLEHWPIKDNNLYISSLREENR